MRPHKALGQHFLIDTNVIDDLVAHIHPQPEEQILEIGAGTGALTQALLRQKAHIVAIEFDQRLVQLLIHKYAGSRCSIVAANAQTFDYAQHQISHIVGNLPYNIASQIILQMLPTPHWQRATFLVQYEMATRLCAEPNNKNFGRFTLMCRFWCSAKRIFDVAAESFNPAPKVNSSVVELTAQRVYDPDLYQQFALLVKTGFSSRRKIVANTLRIIASVDQLKSVDIDPSLRAENIPFEGWYQLAKLLHSA